MDYLISCGNAGFRVQAVLAKVHLERKRKPGKRGVCLGMSAASRRRLILFLLEYEIPGVDVWGVTLTVTDCSDPVEWRRTFKRFQASCNDHQIGGFVWRVELQKRGVPHLHLIFWGCRFKVEQLRRDWLSVWGLTANENALKHAVDFSLIESDSWFSYVVFHQFKHDQKQSGWLGRHWGIVGKRFFTPRAKSEYSLTGAQYDRVRSILFWFIRRDSRARGGRVRRVPHFSGWSQVASDWEFLVRRVVQHVKEVKA